MVWRIGNTWDGWKIRFLPVGLVLVKFIVKPIWGGNPLFGLLGDAMID
jgi:hypothetical protein